MKLYFLIGIIILFLISIFNKKLSVFKIIWQQFSIYKNDKTKKKSWYDIFTFFINPAIISILLIFIIDYKFLFGFSELIITVLSIVATILFSFLTLLIEKNKNDGNEKVVQVSNETYISIIMTIIYSLIALILTICLLLLPDKICLFQIFNSLIYYFIIKIVFNILMILKRMFLLLNND